MPKTKYLESFTPLSVASLSGRALDLILLVMILLVDALLSGGGALLLEVLAHGTVEFFFKDGLSLNGFELGLEVFHVMGRRVAATTSIRHVGSNVFEFFARCSPVTLSAAALLRLGWIGISVAGFGKIAWKPRLTLGSAVSDASMVTVSELVRASHD